MVELIMAIATLTVIIMGWSRLSKALDWAGDEISKTSTVISNVTEAGGEQTLRGVVLSRESLLKTMTEFKESESKRIAQETKYKAKLTTEEEKKAYSDSEKYLKDLLNRNK